MVRPGDEGEDWGFWGRLPAAIAAARAEGGDDDGPKDGGKGRSCAANIAAACCYKKLEWPYKF